MKVVLQSKVAHLAIALLAFFVPMALLLDPLTLYLITGSVLFTTSVTAAAAYWPVVRYTLRTRAHYINKTDVLSIGIVLLFTSTAFREVYITFWREFFPLRSTRPDEYFYPLAFVRYMGIVAAVLSLCARRVIFGPSLFRKIPGWPSAILSVLVGIAIGTGMMLYL